MIKIELTLTEKQVIKLRNTLDGDRTLSSVTDEDFAAISDSLKLQLTRYKYNKKLRKIDLLYHKKMRLKH
jgi:hypothetical protein